MAKKVVQMRGRFRTSSKARRVYVCAILFVAAVWCYLEVKNGLDNPGGPVDQSEVGTTTLDRGRKLLSGGVEIIPGFTGAKCGNNWYIKGEKQEFHEKYTKWNDWDINSGSCTALTSTCTAGGCQSGFMRSTASTTYWYYFNAEGGVWDGYPGRKALQVQQGDCMPCQSTSINAVLCSGDYYKDAMYRSHDKSLTIDVNVADGTSVTGTRSADVYMTGDKTYSQREKYMGWEADSGGIVYVILSIYLFLGVAIICDGHFVDSLEMICSKYGLNINPDVAGATFMAAGSSAPELATSFLGVFVAASPVGLGTILGSAVFNILIIVGSVAILTGEPLKLDYRPVVRDNFFYGVSVILLCVLLAVDDQANLYDTIILLAWYFIYLIFLGWNEMFMGMLGCVPPADDDDEIECTDTPASPKMGDVHVEDMADTVPAAAAVVTAQESDYKKCFDLYATDGALMTKDLAPILIEAGLLDPEHVKEEPELWEAEIDFDQFAAEDVAMDERALNGQQVLALIKHKEGEGAGSAEGNGTGMGKGAMPDEPPPQPSEGGPVSPPPKNDTDMVEVELKEGKCDAEEDDEEKKKRRPSYSTGIWKVDKEEPKGDEEEEDEEPQSCLDIVLAVFSWPYEFIFNWTMPNCHLEMDEEEEEAWEEKYEEASPEEKKVMMDEAMASLTCGQRWFWATFFISLIHITWLSFFMVEFMLKIGCLWGIPDVVMGLTFLAMGTSIPDALGSVSVAQDGEGDMAVSNAVGSNVFDICVGLGLPWFIKLCIEAGNECNYIPIFNASADVIPSIIILLAIIVILFTVFLVGKWTLYPQSGYVLYGAYFVFIIYQLLNTYVINPNQKECTYSDDKCC